MNIWKLIFLQIILITVIFSTSFSIKIKIEEEKQQKVLNTTEEKLINWIIINKWVDLNDINLPNMKIINSFRNDLINSEIKLK